MVSNGYRGQSGERIRTTPAMAKTEASPDVEGKRSCLCPQRDRRDADVVILGAGIAGGVCAKALHRLGYDVLVIERQSDPGGLLKPVCVGGCEVDLGPHFLFHPSGFEEVRGWAQTFGDVVTLKPYAWSCPSGDLGTPHDYPISERNARSLGVAIPETHTDHDDSRPEDFESAIVGLVGRVLYEVYFQNFSKKFWGVEPRTLRPDWAPKKIRVTAQHEPFFGDGECYRPCRGFGPLVKDLFEGIPIHNDTVVSLTFSKDKVKEALCRDAGPMRASHFVSTIRPDVLLGTRDLHVRGVTLVYAILAEADALFSNDRVYWTYFPNHYHFTRLTDMTKACVLPSSSPRILCFEFPDDSPSQRSEIRAVEEARWFLSQPGPAKRDVVDCVAFSLPEATPVPSRENARRLARIDKRLTTVTNLTRIGRFGSFTFSWLRDAVVSGLRAAERICSIPSNGACL